MNITKVTIALVAIFSSFGLFLRGFHQKDGWKLQYKKAEADLVLWT